MLHLAAAMLFAAAGAVTIAPDPAQAAPPSRVEQARQKIEELSTRVSVATEDYNQARLDLAAAKQQARSLNSRAQRQHARTDRLRHRIGAMAASAYMGGGSDIASVITAQTPQDAVDKATSLAQLSDQDGAEIARLAQASKTLTTQRAGAAKALKTQRRLNTRLGAKKTTVVAALAKQKQLVTQLENRGDDRGTRGGGRDTPPGDLPPASGRAADAIEFAKAQLGKPYQWGAEGPGSYDCSGLTMMAWRAGGVSLPHSSRAQYGIGANVPRSQLQPGDLVFFGNPIHHVGLYVGGGQMIAAPSSGKVVSYASINNSYYRSEWTGATRPR